MFTLAKAMVMENRTMSRAKQSFFIVPPQQEEKGEKLFTIAMLDTSNDACQVQKERFNHSICPRTCARRLCINGFRTVPGTPFFVRFIHWV
jgi:hypothetical protein